MECNTCKEIDAVRVKGNKIEAELRKDKSYNRRVGNVKLLQIRQQQRKLERAHAKCHGCELLFGTSHLAHVESIYNQHELCQYCTHDVAKFGYGLLNKNRGED
jgi:hypothetical protein